MFAITQDRFTAWTIALFVLCMFFLPPAVDSAEPQELVHMFFTWLEEPKADRRQNASTLGLIAFRGWEAGARPELVLWQPDNRRDNAEGNYANASPTLAEILEFRVEEGESGDPSAKRRAVNVLRDALRTQGAEPWMAGPEYSVYVHRIPQPAPEIPVTTSETGSLKEWNELLAPSDAEGDRTIGPYTLELVWSSDSAPTTIVLDRDLLFLRGLRTDEDAAAWKIEAAAAELLRAIAQNEDREQRLSIDLSNPEGACSPLASLVRENLEIPLNTPGAAERRKSLQQQIFNRLSDQLEISGQTAVSWRIENRGLLPANLSKGVFYQEKTKPTPWKIPRADLSIAGCTVLPIRLSVTEGRGRGEKVPSPRLEHLFELEAVRRETEGWQLELRAQPYARPFQLEEVELDQGALVVRLSRLSLPDPLLPGLFVVLVLMVLAGLIGWWFWRRLRTPRKEPDLQPGRWLLRPQDLREPRSLLDALRDGNDGWIMDLRKSFGRSGLWRLRLWLWKRRLDTDAGDHTVKEEMVAKLNRELDTDSRLLDVNRLSIDEKARLRSETSRLLKISSPTDVSRDLRNRLVLGVLLPNIIHKVECVEEQAAEEQCSKKEVLGDSSSVEEVRRRDSEPEPEADQEPLHEEDEVPIEPEEKIAEDDSELIALNRKCEEPQRPWDEAGREIHDEDVETVQQDAQGASLSQDRSTLENEVEKELSRSCATIENTVEQLRAQEEQISRARSLLEEMGTQLSSQKDQLSRGRSTLEKRIEQREEENRNLLAELNSETGWLGKLNELLTSFLTSESTVSQERVAKVLSDRDDEALREALTHIHEQGSQDRSLIAEILTDLTADVGGEAPIEDLTQASPEDPRHAYRELLKRRRCLDLVRGSSPKVANVTWLVDALRQVAECLVELGEGSSAELLDASNLTPKRLGEAVKSVAQEGEGRWNKKLQEASALVADDGPEAVSSAKMLGEYLNWLLDGKPLETLTNVLRLEQVTAVYCKDSSDQRADALYRDTARYRAACGELRKRLEWLGVRMAPIAFFEPADDGKLWRFDEHREGRPLIFESTFLQELAVNKLRGAREDLRKTVGDVSTWGFSCEDYPEIKSDSRGWLCRGWRNL